MREFAGERESDAASSYNDAYTSGRGPNGDRGCQRAPTRRTRREIYCRRSEIRKEGEKYRRRHPVWRRGRKGECGKGREGESEGEGERTRAREREREMEREGTRDRRRGRNKKATDGSHKWTDAYTGPVYFQHNRKQRHTHYTSRRRCGKKLPTNVLYAAKEARRQKRKTRYPKKPSVGILCRDTAVLLWCGLWV